MNLLSTHLRLSDLNELVAELVAEAFPGPFWIVAEVADAKSAGPSGHTYLDLVEKRGGEITAQARANLWRTRRDVLHRFERVTRRRLERGMQLLILAQPTLHARYGYALEIHDIDPNFTLGDMARRRQEVIDRLTDEALLDRNRGLPLSPAPQRIAVISSRTAAGWQDFQHCLARNAHGYGFYPILFAALVQGERAEESIGKALSEIRRSVSQFDCVVVIRGGGATVDLSCFDSYGLARAMAEFPLPIVSGIGHERDTSVCDLVAFHAAATPTAAAEFLISRVRNFEEELRELAGAVLLRVRSLAASETAAVDRLSQRVLSVAQSRVQSESEALQALAHRGNSAVRASVLTCGSELSALQTRVDLVPKIGLREQIMEIASLQRELCANAERLLERRSAELTLLEHDVRNGDPIEILRRGYSITRINGRSLRDARDAAAGARIETRLHRGRIESLVDVVEVSE